MSVVSMSSETVSLVVSDVVEELCTVGSSLVPVVRVETVVVAVACSESVAVIVAEGDGFTFCESRSAAETLSWRWERDR